MKKKLLSILIAGVMVFSLAACSGGEKASTDDKTQKEETTEKTEKKDGDFKVGISMKTLDGAYFTALSTHCLLYTSDVYKRQHQSPGNGCPLFFTAGDFCRIFILDLLNSENAA